MCVDCGANVGEVTSIMRSKGAKVHAFEPNPFAYDIISEKFKDDKNVILHKQAVSDKPGTLKLYFRNEHNDDPVKFSVGSTLVDEKNDVNLENACDVTVISLTDYIKSIGPIKILKIDIEGEEQKVLEDLISKEALDNIGLVLIETHEEWIPSQVEWLVKIKAELKRRKIDNVFLNWA